VVCRQRLLPSSLCPEQGVRCRGPSGIAYASDDDPELVKAAAPFGLKLTESLLAENPQHLGLPDFGGQRIYPIFYAFVQEEADEVEPHDFAAAEAMRARARHLYLRARNTGCVGLEVSIPAFGKTLLANPKATVRMARNRMCRCFIWTAAAWASAIFAFQGQPRTGRTDSAMEALMDRALELDESFNHGAIHTFQVITYEMSRFWARPAIRPAARARKQFRTRHGPVQGNRRLAAGRFRGGG